MATKKKPSIPEAILKFKEVSQRATLLDYVYVNNVLFSTNTKNQNVFIEVDDLLWNPLTEDEELKDKFKPIKIDNPHNIGIYEKYFIGNEGFVNIDDCESFVKGIDKIKIDIENFEYPIYINKDLIPLKLRKAESNNISYKTVRGISMLLCVKKYFPFVIVDEETNEEYNYGFSLSRAFRVV